MGAPRRGGRVQRVLLLPSVEVEGAADSDGGRGAKVQLNSTPAPFGLTLTTLTVPRHLLASGRSRINGGEISVAEDSRDGSTCLVTRIVP